MFGGVLLLLGISVLCVGGAPYIEYLDLFTPRLKDLVENTLDKGSNVIENIRQDAEDTLDRGTNVIKNIKGKLNSTIDIDSIVPEDLKETFDKGNLWKVKIYILFVKEKLFGI